MNSLEIFVVLLSAQQVLGEFINPCSNTTKVSPLKDFDIKKLSGKEWYDITYVDTYPADTPDMLISCASLNYSSTSDPHTYEVNLSCYFNRSESESEPMRTRRFELTLDHDYPAWFRYDYNGTHYTYLDTDYKTWTLSYGCYDGFGDRDGTKEQFTYAFIRSSTRTLDKKIYDKLVSDIEKLGFIKKNFHPVIQTNC